MITIDVQKETVDIGRGHVLKRQWVTFYLALAFRLVSSDSTSLDIHELRLLWPWFLKKPESGGKEVARHLKQLAQWGLGDLVTHGDRTKRWRLNVEPDRIVFRPSMGSCKAWLEEKRLDPLDALDKAPRFVIAWLEHTTDAIIHLLRGRIRKGLQRIEAAKSEAGGWTLLGASAELVEIRLRARQGEYPYLDEFQFLSRCSDSIGRALRIRAELAQALEPERTPEGCRSLLISLQGLPDINGLGTAYNALGVLLRRKGQFDLAERCLVYAAALLVASFDLSTLQAAVFNLGHTLYMQASNDEELREALRLIELDRHIYRSLGIGGDSAQAEIVAGAICLRLGEIGAAEEWLRGGREIASTLGSEYNSACIEQLEARICWARSWKEREDIPESKREEILSHYEKAKTLLFQAGFPTLEVENEAAGLGRGEPPKWLR